MPAVHRSPLARSTHGHGKSSRIPDAEDSSRESPIPPEVSATTSRDDGWMEFRDVVRRRRMIRRYASQPVDPAAVDRMLEHAQHAPNAGFSQGWAFLVLDTPTDVDLFWWATGANSRPSNAWLEGMRTAPVIIVPLACKDAYLDRYAEPDKGWTDRNEDRWAVPYWYVDT